MNVVQKGCTFIMYFELHVQLLSQWTRHVKENYIYTKEYRTLTGLTLACVVEIALINNCRKARQLLIIVEDRVGNWRPTV
jgi:hypothetical protein